MNQIYRSIWNEALGVWIAVSELSKGQGKRSSTRRRLLATGLLVCTSPAWALPTGESTHGRASHVLARQTPIPCKSTRLSQKAVINWQGFSIDQNQAVNIATQCASRVIESRCRARCFSKFKGKSTPTDKFIWSILTASYLVKPRKSMSVVWLLRHMTSAMLILWREKITSPRTARRAKSKITARLIPKTAASWR